MNPSVGKSKEKLQDRTVGKSIMWKQIQDHMFKSGRNTSIQPCTMSCLSLLMMREGEEERGPPTLKRWHLQTKQQYGTSATQNATHIAKTPRYSRFSILTLTFLPTFSRREQWEKIKTRHVLTRFCLGSTYFHSSLFTETPLLITLLDLDNCPYAYQCQLHTHYVIPTLL